MVVAEIHFNHDPMSASNDALNLREDGGRNSQIEAPEWANGDSKPVAYAAAAIKRQVTIKVRFKDAPPGTDTLNIRAVPPGSNTPFGPIHMPHVLGDVEKRLVQFNSAGQSALETFTITGDLATAHVGAYDTYWEWQAMENGQWEPFETTHHRVFVLPALPAEPWNQLPGANIRWPWATALERACVWAFGTTTVDEATAAIAEALNTHPKHHYDESGVQFVPTKNSAFRLTTYLSELTNARSFIIDCRGIATAMVTFSNLMGASLMPLQLENDDSSFFTTKAIKPLNAGFTFEEWGYHEITVIQQAALEPGTVLTEGTGADLLIYDASLRFDQQDLLLPVQMPLGSVAAGSDYRFELIDTVNGDDGDKVKPLAIRTMI